MPNLASRPCLGELLCALVGSMETMFANYERSIGYVGMPIPFLDPVRTSSSTAGVLACFQLEDRYRQIPFFCGENL